MSSTDDLPERREGRTYGVPARRARIIELLTEAYARDDLEQGEFERRLERAEGARTIEELDELVADFPSHLVNVEDSAAARSPAPGGAGPMTGEALEREVARLDALAAPTAFNIIGSRRTVVRPEDSRVVRSVSLIGDSVVDVRPLAGASGIVLVKVAALLGSTKIIVPRGTQVDLRLVNVIGNQKRVTRGGFMKRLARKLGVVEESSEQAPRPAPTVVVTGMRVIGDTVVVEE